jgi:ABC-type nitrate/sulfonate/bicarbonate transport system permease component
MKTKIWSRTLRRIRSAGKIRARSYLRTHRLKMPLCISVRESAVLGLVGVGGIGMAIDSAMNLFQWDRVALMLVAIFAVVLVAELAVTYIRKRII